MRTGRLANTRAVLSVFVALTSIAIIGQTIWAISLDRRLQLNSEREHGLVAVRLLEEHASQHLGAAAQRLALVAQAAAQLMQAAPIADQQIYSIIESTLRNSRADGALQFVNPAGYGWASMFDFPAFVFPKEPRPYIAYLLAHPGHHALVVGRPFRRFIDGALIIPLARNVYDHGGRHIGLVSTEVELIYFNTVYDRAARTSRALAQLLTDEGIVVVRSPFDAAAIDLDISSTPLFRRLKGAGAEGAVEEMAGAGNALPYLLTFRRVHGFPMTIVFGRELEVILADWSARTVDRILFSGIFIVLHLLLTYYLLLHMQRLQQADEKLRQSEARFVDLFQRSPIPLALMRQDTHELIEANDAILQQFGYTREAFLGRTPMQLQMWVHPEARQPYLDLLAANQFVDRYEVLLRNHDGSSLTCLLSTRLIDSAGMRMAIFSPIDVTRQREIEHEIRELNAELEARVEQRTFNLQEALGKVRKMQGELVRNEKLAALGSLVAGVAHELNTPIGNSLTVASTVSDQALALRAELAGERPRRSLMDQLSNSMVTGMDILVRNLERIATLVTSFKQVAVDQSSDQRRQFDLKTAIDGVLLALAPMLRHGRHTIALALDPGIHMDSYPEALAQVMTNLVSNAVRHGFDGREQGRLAIGARGMDNGQVEIVFSDNGQGIRAEHLGRVFDPFFTTKLGQGGSGLGMHIVYNLVTGVLGGTIELDSTGGRGTTLTMKLPCVAPVLAPVQPL
jgi:PAS domain S-box-containing protein